MNERDKRKIAIGAELLHERIENSHYSVSDTPANVESSDIDGLDRRIFDELEKSAEKDLEESACISEWPPNQELPVWVDTLSEINEWLSERSASAIDGSEDVPFEPFFDEIVEIAFHEFANVNEYFGEQSIQDIKRHLIERISNVGSQAIHIDFISFIAEREPAVIEQQNRSPESTCWLNDYISCLMDGRVVQLFKEFPVLARLVSVVVEQWGQFVSLLSTRLSEDYGALCELCDGADLGKVKEVSMGVGDPHEDGATVTIITFETGESLVYKPRDVRPEKELYQFESWLADTFDEFPDLQTPDLLLRPEYGWVKWVNRVEFTSSAGVQRYYRRAGAFLCVLYVLNVTDCHFENIVAGNSSPVLVDAETIVQPIKSIQTIPDWNIDEKIERYFSEQSVLSTLSLPFTLGETTNGLAGLSSIRTSSSNTVNINWENVNNDAIDLEYYRTTITPEKNYPILDGKPVPPNLFVEDIVQGFKKSYDIISASKDQIRQYIIDEFDELRTRTILRESVLYQSLLDTLTNPEYLRSGIKQSHKMRKTLLHQPSGTFLPDEREWWDDVFKSERDALIRRNIPCFDIYTDSCGVYNQEQVVTEEIYGTPGVSHLADRLGRLSATDKEMQAKLIKASLTDGNIESIDKNPNWKK